MNSKQKTLESARELQRIYSRRFGRTAEYRCRVWQVLTGAFFSRWVGPDATVLDLGCGYGEFINHVRARRKFAIDLNPDARRHLLPDVTFLEQDCAAPWPVAEASLDAIFTSNFMEHLPDKQCLRRVLAEARRALRCSGRFIAMGPNIRYLPGAYWDFFDHQLPLTEKSLGEALETAGFRLEQVVARFLPYTLVNAPEYPLVFLRLYLALPALWRIWGRQFLVVAMREGN